MPERCVLADVVTSDLQAFTTTETTMWCPFSTGHIPQDTSCPRVPAPEKSAVLQVERHAIKLARANGELLYGIPLERVAGLSHPAPKLLRVKVQDNPEMHV